MERDEIERIVEDNMALLVRQTAHKGTGAADPNRATETSQRMVNRHPHGRTGVSVVPAILVFAMALLISFSVIGTLACSDGWVSGSIGRAGACSHHGGVNRLPWALAFLVSVFLAVRFHLYRINHARAK